MFSRGGEEGELEEEAVPVLKLLRPGLNHPTQEKPVFPGSVTDPNLCIPLELSHEDRVPYTINRYLRDYQREGIKFMYNNYIHSTGCILGDDMGLGKTVQVQRKLAVTLTKELLKMLVLVLDVASHGCLAFSTSTSLPQVIGFLAAVLHKTGTWEDIENNRPLFLQSQIPSKQSNPSKVGIEIYILQKTR